MILIAGAICAIVSLLLWSVIWRELGLPGVVVIVTLVITWLVVIANLVAFGNWEGPKL